MYHFIPQQLKRNIDVRAKNRPVKIAYIVPYTNIEKSHLILDAIFYESYARWGGARTLIIPSDINKFQYSEYEKWLEYFDADFIYTYVELEIELIKKIERICCPILFIKHNIKNSTQGWRSYLPSWSSHSLNFVSSITTLSWMVNDHNNMPTIVAQQDEEVPSIRFVRDNFGINCYTDRYISSEDGLFNMLYLIPEGKSDTGNVGTKKTNSILEILNDVTLSHTLTFSQLASACCTSIPKIDPDDWGYTFNLFIGNSCLDRINFWNSRHFIISKKMIPCSLILDANFLQDDDNLKQLGHLLNKLNWLRRGSSGPYEVSLRSLSLSEYELGKINEKLNNHTNNTVGIPENFSAPVLPKKFRKGWQDYNNDEYEFKLNETINKGIINEPLHFSLMPPQFNRLKEGQWAIDLNIERHNNLSKFDYARSYWRIPRWNNVSSCFTPQRSKITKNYMVTVIPAKENRIFDESSLKYELCLPQDEDVFRKAVIKYGNLLANDDVRSSISDETYQDLILSDKGKSLRGLISMFKNLREAYECLTNKFWREKIRELFYPKNGTSHRINEKRTKNFTHEKVFKWEQIYQSLNKDQDYKKRVRQAYSHVEGFSENKHIRASCENSLEFLVQKDIFYQVYPWACDYCGHINIRSIDALKKENKCEICQTYHYVPIQFEWQYKLNEFVTNILCNQNGFTVLWVLGYLQDMNLCDDFYFLPEVNLYINDKLDGEIDILCVRAGEFCAVEAKKTVRAFLQAQEIDKFIKKVKLIKPNVAILAFEEYGVECALKLMSYAPDFSALRMHIREKTVFVYPIEENWHYYVIDPGQDDTEEGKLEKEAVDIIKKTIEQKTHGSNDYYLSGKQAETLQTRLRKKDELYDEKTKQNELNRIRKELEKTTERIRDRCGIYGLKIESIVAEELDKFNQYPVQLYC